MFDEQVTDNHDSTIVTIIVDMKWSFICLTVEKHDVLIYGKNG